MDVMQYMSMFLEESLDNLQSLNESLLELENNPEDMDKLNEIFRAAHTLKGMAATMGYSKMAELTHKMEDILSEFRDGKLRVSKKVVTVIFSCLDALERLVRGIEAENREDYDITELIEELEEVAKKSEDSTKNDEIHTLEEDINHSEIRLNEYDRSILEQAEERGYTSYELKITLSENTLLKSARAFLIFRALEEAGEILKAEPPVEEIENENFDREFSLVYTSLKEAEDIKASILAISEVQRVSINILPVRNSKEKLNHHPINALNEIAATKEASIPKAAAKDIKEKQKTKGGSIEHKRNHQSVRVDIERLDMLMNMVSELVIHRTRLEQLSQSYKSTEIYETLEQVGRSTSELQDLVMKIRMLPLDVVFNRFPRMIRDLSLELNKEMDFVIEGSESELDRTVIDEIGEPLIHLLRNAADHGIESKEERIASGKNPVGRIKLTAYQEGTKGVIKVEDDGAGLNLARIEEKAKRIGVNTDAMSPNDIRNLIFLEGFSTNDKVTDLSGRGVGMDVVKTKITELGGTVEVSSEEGKGTSFIIKLPLTLQIIQALLVKVGSETFAISLGYIDRVIDFHKNILRKSKDREVILYRDSVIPLIRVQEKLQLESTHQGKQFVIIVKIGEQSTGLLVDSLLGQREIVIKPLGKTLSSLNQYIGATILGDGLVTLILDAASLAK